MKIKVVDTLTGKYPDLEEVALHEEWAKGLMYCDMDGFALCEDGELILMDECGNFRYCPEGRFEVKIEIGKNQYPKSPHDCSGVIT